MDIKELYKKEKGIVRDLTYLNDNEEFVIDIDFYYWLEAKFTSDNSECTPCSHHHMVEVNEYRCADCGWVSSSS